jgi:hypothetical protein
MRTSISTAAVVLALLAVAGCGPRAAATTPTNSTPDASIVQMIACFRAHGLTNFPDPEFDPNDGRWHLANNRPDIPPDVSAACAANGGQVQPRTPIPTNELNDLMGFARCVRAHGLPDWPDPEIDGTFVTAIEPKTVPGDPFGPCESFLASTGGHINMERPRG